jgi:hypothetical protein
MTTVTLIMITIWVIGSEPDEPREVTHTYEYRVQISTEGNGSVLVPYLDRAPITYVPQNGSQPEGIEWVDSIHGAALKIDFHKKPGIGSSNRTETWFNDWKDFTMEENGTSVWIYYEPWDSQPSNASIRIYISHESNAVHSGQARYEIEGQLKEGWHTYLIRDYSIAA